MERLKELYERYYNAFPYAGSLGFVDTETSGLSRSARIIEIGAIAIDFDGIDVQFDTYETLINPGFQIDAKITELTKIANEDLNKAPGDEVYDDFIEWMQTKNFNKLIAHNAQFDERMLRSNFERLNKRVSIPSFECTMKMSKKMLNSIENNKLVTVANHYNFSNQSAHRALSDTEVCAYIYAKMMLGEK